ncbi:MAG: hypothetical protein HKN26_11585 [Acidimicrobiales bacterium]|nr:hypothetical protein [Acidimicrobiales bacterium]
MATELAIIFPVILVIVLTPVQIGLFYHARQAADLAAERYVDAARAYQATSADGVAAANQILNQGGNLADAQIIPGAQGPDTVSVTIRGNLNYSIVPGTWSVEASAEGAVERFIPEPER